MPDILRRQHAPISDDAWDELDRTAADILRDTLTGRRIVDFSGPHGWETAAVNLGQVKTSNKKAPGGIPFGIRQVQPLMEFRLPFALGQWELDNLTRGKKNVDLEPLEQAAQQAAMLEDTAVFLGFKDGQIGGLIPSSEHKAVNMPGSPEGLAKAVADGVKAISLSGIGGPFALVLGTDEYFTLKQSAKTGYPAYKSAQDVLDGGKILHSPVLSGGVLISTRGGDFELTVGKDLSIGYAGHDTENVSFFLTESFTFRVIEPKAVVELRAGK